MTPFSTKTVEIDLIGYLAHFGQFCQTEGQMWFYLNFEAIFRNLSSFSTFSDPICHNFRIFIFDRYVISANLIMFTSKNKTFWKNILDIFFRSPTIDRKWAWVMYVGMYACMHACMYVCMYVCIYVCLYVCIYVCLSVCMLYLFLNEKV